MTPPEKFICAMADAIRAGHLSVTGEMEYREVGHSFIEWKDLDKPQSVPDWYKLTCELDCKRKEKE